MRGEGLSSFQDFSPVKKDPIDSWHIYSIGTKTLLKKPEVMMCMTYFPVVFKVKHMAEMLEYIEVIHGRDLMTW